MEEKYNWNLKDIFKTKEEFDKIVEREITGSWVAYLDIENCDNDEEDFKDYDVLEKTIVILISMKDLYQIVMVIFYN